MGIGLADRKTTTKVFAVIGRLLHQNPKESLQIQGAPTTLDWNPANPSTSERELRRLEASRAIAVAEWLRSRHRLT